MFKTIPHVFNSPKIVLTIIKNCHHVDHEYFHNYSRSPRNQSVVIFEIAGILWSITYWCIKYKIWSKHRMIKKYINNTIGVCRLPALHNLIEKYYTWGHTGFRSTNEWFYHKSVSIVTFLRINSIHKGTSLTFLCIEFFFIRSVRLWTRSRLQYWSGFLIV